MTVGDRIRIKREALGLTQDELSKKLGYKSRSSVNKMENSRELPLKKVEKMANVLGCSPAYLMGWDESTSPSLQSTATMVMEESVYETKTNKSHSKSSIPHKVPVLGYVRAGIPLNAVEEILDWEEIPEKWLESGDEYFALSIKGDSMEPKFSEGDVAIIRKQDDVESGDIAIILVNGDDATCKKVMKYSGGVRLVPWNPAYEVLDFSNQEIEELPVKIIGKVVELRAKFL